MGVNSEGKNLLLWEQFLSLKSRPSFIGMILSLRQANKSHKKCPFVKMAEKHDSVTSHLMFFNQIYNNIFLHIK